MTPAPSRRPEGRPVGQCFLPWAFLPYDTCRDGGPAYRGASRPRCVPRAGFEYPHRGVHHRPSRRLAAPERPSASPFKAFSSRRSDRLPAAPALMALLASIRLAPQGGVRTRSTPGPRSRREFVRTIGSRRTRCVDAFLGFTLQSTLPLRPGTLLWSQSLPPARVGWCDVQSHLRLGVLRREGVGWPLSGLPALLGFVTLRPSRRRSGRRAGRAYGFASRLARVAGGANRSVPRQRRPSRRRSADPSSAVHR
jgi:hypothetical protein